MRKKMFSFKNFVMLFMAIGLLTSVGCSKQDDSNEVDPVKKEVESLKKDFEAKSKALQSQLDQAKKDLQALSSKEGVTKAELDKAKKEVVDLTVAKTAFEAYKTEQTSKEESTNKRISALETLVGKNKAALDEALEELKKDMKGMDISAQVEELKKSIADNKVELSKMLNDYKTTNDAKVEELNKKFAALEEKMNMNVVASLLNSRLTSLVFLPEYVADNGGALPLINFQPLFVTCTDYKVKDKNNRDVYYEYVADGAVLLKYVVNPSSVTEADIDTENLKFFYNDPKVMKKTKAEEISAKAEFVSLKDGVLTVKASADVTESWLYLGRNTPTHSGNPDDRIDQLMLQVPTMAGKNDDDSPKYTMVSSDWAKIVYEEKLPALVKDVTPAPANWGEYVLSSTVRHAKDSVDVNDVRVVKLQYDQPLDLKEVVESMMYDKTTDNISTNWTGWTDLNDEFYNFEFEFDLNQYDQATDKSTPIEYMLNVYGSVEPTDQQQFIKLDGSIARAKVYSRETLRSAIGRTPIVHVMLKSKEDGAGSCTVKHGYIKLQIVEKKQDPVFFTKEAEYVAGCDNIIYRVGTQTANEELYSLVGLTRDEFANDYYTVQVDEDDIAKDHKYLNKDGYVYDGRISVYRDKTWSSTAVKLSDNVVYVLDRDDIWNNIGKTVWKQAILKSKSGRRDIVVQFAVKIKKEVANLNILFDNYSYGVNSDNKVEFLRLNSSVPKQDGTTTTITNSVGYTTNLAKAFANENGSRIKLEFGQDKGKYSDYTYKFVFDEVKAQPINGKVITYNGKDVTVKLQVVNNTELQAAFYEKNTEVMPYQTVAKISGNDVTYAKTDVAKYLLNYGFEFMKAKLILEVYNNCTPEGRKVDVVVNRLQEKDRFNVHFLRPVSLSPKSAGSFVDGVDAGATGSYIDFKKFINPYDWRVEVKDNELYYFNNDKHGDYYDFYGLNKDNIEVDTDNIAVEGLTVGGVKVEKLEPNIVKYDSAKGKLTYKNQDLNLRKKFTLIIPVSATYEYGTVKGNVRVDVLPTETKEAKRKAAK